MSTAHIIQTIIEVLLLIAIVVGLIYEPVIAEWEKKQGEKMLKAFPNIKVTEKNGNIIWVCDILSDIQPYYFRVFTPKITK